MKCVMTYDEWMNFRPGHIINIPQPAKRLIATKWKNTENDKTKLDLANESLGPNVCFNNLK
jgi:hypothetical protein